MKFNFLKTQPLQIHLSEIQPNFPISFDGSPVQSHLSTTNILNLNIDYKLLSNSHDLSLCDMMMAHYLLHSTRIPPSKHNWCLRFQMNFVEILEIPDLLTVLTPHFQKFALWNSLPSFLLHIVFISRPQPVLNWEICIRLGLQWFYYIIFLAPPWNGFCRESR